MRNLFLASFLICGAFLVGVGAQAQQIQLAQAANEPITQPVPEKMPFDVPYGTPISLENAQKAGEAAVAEARKRNWKLACAVVEPSGDLVYFEKMDGTLYGSIQIAQDKAVTSARFRRATKVLFDAVQHGNPYVLSLRGTAPVEGGFPIVVGGKLIGGIGCSGGAGNQDATAAKAGADTIK